MKLKIADIREGMIIKSHGETVEVTEVWANQGVGLGIMVKGKNTKTGKDWSCRYTHPDEQEVKRV